MISQSESSAGCHQQDTDYYCGAACAQMVLESIGAGLLDRMIFTRTTIVTALWMRRKLGDRT